MEPKGTQGHNCALISPAPAENPTVQVGKGTETKHLAADQEQWTQPVTIEAAG